MNTKMINKILNTLLYDFKYWFCNKGKEPVFVIYYIIVFGLLLMLFGFLVKIGILATWISGMILYFILFIMTIHIMVIIGYNLWEHVLYKIYKYFKDIYDDAKE